LDWSDNFSKNIATNFANHGAIPELTWQPQSRGAGVNYQDVLAGKWDIYLNQFAQDARSMGFNIRISLAPEMNSDWVLWGTGRDGNSADGFQQFWRYVVEKFRANGANNISWVWTPNVQYYGQKYSYSELYPGDSWVDFLGVDGYNWGTSQSWSEWQSFREVFQPSYNALTNISGKKILIMETASTELGGNKAQWISQMFSDLPTVFPRVQGFTWFNINKETDWRINSSAAAQAAFSAGAKGLPGASSTKGSAKKKIAGAAISSEIKNNDSKDSSSDSTLAADEKNNENAEVAGISDNVFDNLQSQNAATNSNNKLNNLIIIFRWIILILSLGLIGQGIYFCSKYYKSKSQIVI
jgi:hypothetical protein